MKHWPLLLAIFFLLAAHTHAQSDSGCAILARSIDASGSFAYVLLAPDNQEAVQIDRLPVPDDGLAFDQILSPGRVIITAVHWEPDRSFRTEVYDVAPTGFRLTDSVHFPIPDHMDGIAPRYDDPWSFDGRYVALRNTYGIRNARLFVYDLRDRIFFEPTTLWDVYYVAWSPDRNVLAYIAYNYLPNGGASPNFEHYGLYVTGFDGTPILEVPLDPREFARFSWLSEQELGITTCVQDGCRAEIHNISSGAVTHLQLGNYLLEARTEFADHFLVSSLEDRNLALISESGETEPLTRFDRVLSGPALSYDRRFVALEAELGGQFRLYIVDLENPGDVMFVDLYDDVPELLTGNDADSLPYQYGFYYAPGYWHPFEDKLAFSDQNVIYIYDPSTRSVERIAGAESGSQLGGPIWVCSSALE